MEKNKALKKAGLKITHPRIAVLEILRQPENQHVSAEEVYKILIEQGQDIGLATVYRVLNQFDVAGLVERHHFEGGKSVFELSDRQPHYHLVCLKTDKVIEFQDDLIRSRLMEIAEEHDMDLRNHSLYLYGESRNNKA
ncbi:MAG: ferric iron uptake transcriptional regulator [Pseudomonadota bacterium]